MQPPPPQYLSIYQASNNLNQGLNYVKSNFENLSNYIQSYQLICSAANIYQSRREMKIIIFLVVGRAVHNYFLMQLSVFPNTAVLSLSVEVGPMKATVQISQVEIL